MFKNVLLHIDIAMRLSLYVLKKSHRALLFGTLFFGWIMALQWSAQYEVFQQIVGMEISSLEKIDIIGDALFAVFKYANSIVPISFMLIALFESLSLVILIDFYRRREDKASKGFHSMAAEVFLAGIFASFGSFFGPVAGVLFSGVQSSTLEFLNYAILISAAFASFWVWLSVSKQCALTLRK